MSDRIDSWKAIADHLGREVRTVQRWENERGLPVRRLPGGDRPRVYALKAELDAWLRGCPAEKEETVSIAVLPFVNLSGDKENEYFGDGLADEIITALARVPNLRVTARTSSFAFRGKERDVREIGTRLGVSALLEGSVRRERNRVRVLVQLASTRDGCHLWSDSYDRDLAEIFAIQDEITSSVTRALSVRLTGRPLARCPTANLDAYALWLKGRYVGAQWTGKAMAEASARYRAAIALDPGFPLPRISLAETLFEASWFGMANPREAGQEAKELVLEALEFDDTLGEAHSMLGALLGALDYDWLGAERAFARALELSPGSVAILYRHGWYFLAPRMRLAQAVEELRQAVGQDPLSPLLHATLGLLLIESRDYECAESECRAAVDLAPNLWWSHLFLGDALIHQAGRAEEALAHVRQACDAFSGAPLAVGCLCLTCGSLGRTDEARTLLAQLEETDRAFGVPPLALAWAYLGLRDERVFDWLARAIDARHPITTHLPGMPYYDAIRGDPRFSALLARMRLS